MFFAGPILGANNWQENGVQNAKIIAAEAKQTIHVANPRWTTIAPDKRLAKNEQRNWEKEHIRHIALMRKFGAVVFWIAAQDKNADPPNPPGRAYGQGTRAEFSHVTGMKFMDDDIQIVLGIDPNHDGHGLHEYRHTAREFGLPVHDSLPAAIKSGAELILRAAANA